MIEDAVEMSITLYGSNEVNELNRALVEVIGK